MAEIYPETLTNLIGSGVIFSEGYSSSHTDHYELFKFEYISFKNKSRSPCNDANNIVIDVSLFDIPKFFIDIYCDYFEIKTYDNFPGTTLLNMQIEYDTISDEQFFQLSVLYDLLGLTKDNLNGIFEISRNIRNRITK